MNIKTCNDTIADGAELKQFSFIISTLCLLVFDLVVILGNLMVILAFLITNKLRTVNGFLISSLAIADLCVGIAVLPFSILNQVLPVWIFGSTWCQLYLFIDMWLCTASIYNLMAITFDRYIAILMPLRYRSLMTTGRGLLMIFIAWLLAFGISCPPMIDYFGGFGLLGVDWEAPVNASSHDSDVQPCECTHKKNGPGYVVFSSTASFWMPFVVILAIYVKIYSILRKLTRQQHLGRMRFSIKKTLMNRFKTTPAGPQMSTKGGIYEGLRIHRGNCARLPPPRQHPLAESKLSQSADPINVTISEAVETLEEDDAITPLPVIKTNHTGHRASIASSINVSEENISGQRITKAACSPILRKIGQQSNGWKRIRDRLHSSKTASAAKQRLEWEMQAIKPVAIITGCFIACWLGFAICYSLGAIPQCSSKEGCVSSTVFSLMFWLGYANSACNPLIYAMFNNDFRAAFNRIANFCWHPHGTPSPGITTAQRSPGNVQNIEMVQFNGYGSLNRQA